MAGSEGDKNGLMTNWTGNFNTFVPTQPKIGGLFNTECLPDNNKLNAELDYDENQWAGSLSSELEANLNAEDFTSLLDLLDNDGKLPAPLTEMDQSRPADEIDKELFALEDSPFVSEGGANLEEFSDLSAAILGNDAPKIEESLLSDETTVDTKPIVYEANETEQPIVINKKSLRKRKPSAKSFQLDIPNVEVVQHDHNDYTIKTKRSRNQTVSFSSDTEDSVANSDLSMATTSKTNTSQSSRGESKDNKYRMRRDKNNVASRRSRQTRKQKFIEMEDQCDILEKENEEMREQIVKMEELAKLMKQHLISKIAK